MPEPTERRIVYQHAFESMARACKADQSPELQRQFAEAGYDMARPRTGYGPEDMQRVLGVATRSRFPGQPMEAAYEAFARLAFQAYRRTLVGQVVMAALSMVRLETGLKLALRGFHSLTNYTRHEVLKLGPHQFTYRMHHTTMPVTYSLGLMKEFFACTGQPNVQVTLGEVAPKHVDLLLNES